MSKIIVITSPTLVKRFFLFFHLSIRIITIILDGLLINSLSHLRIIVSIILRRLLLHLYLNLRIIILIWIVDIFLLLLRNLLLFLVPIHTIDYITTLLNKWMIFLRLICFDFTLSIILLHATQTTTKSTGYNKINTVKKF